MGRLKRTKRQTSAYHTCIMHRLCVELNLTGNGIIFTVSFRAFALHAVRAHVFDISDVSPLGMQPLNFMQYISIYTIHLQLLRRLSYEHVLKVNFRQQKSG